MIYWVASFVRYRKIERPRASRPFREAETRWTFRPLLCRGKIALVAPGIVWIRRAFEYVQHAEIEIAWHRSAKMLDRRHASLLRSLLRPRGLTGRGCIRGCSKRAIHYRTIAAAHSRRLVAIPLATTRSAEYASPVPDTWDRETHAEAAGLMPAAWNPAPLADAFTRENGSRLETAKVLNVSDIPHVCLWSCLATRELLSSVQKARSLVSLFQSCRAIFSSP